MVCLSSICTLGFLAIYKTKLNDSYFSYLSRYFKSPPKPHGFASLPLESKTGMLITLVASGSGAVIYAVDYGDL